MVLSSSWQNQQYEQAETSYMTLKADKATYAFLALPRTALS